MKHVLRAVWERFDQIPMNTLLFVAGVVTAVYLVMLLTACSMGVPI